MMNLALLICNHHFVTYSTYKSLTRIARKVTIIVTNAHDLMKKDFVEKFIRAHFSPALRKAQ